MIKNNMDIAGTRKKISITFDDGPDEVHTPKILEILDAFDVKATFFLVGKNVKKHPALVRAIHRKGHDIGNHTYSHPVSPFVNLRKGGKLFKDEIVRTNDEIEKVTGDRPLFFRPTLAFWDTAAKKLLEDAAVLGHLSVGWSWSTVDWLGSSLIINHKLNSWAGRDRDILLMHDGAEKTLIKKRQATIKMLPKIIENCRRKSLRVVPLTQGMEINSN